MLYGGVTMSKNKSRKRTPWEGKEKLSATQTFLKENYDTFYAERHRKIEDSGESEMINSYIPSKCPFCKAEKFKKADIQEAAYNGICVQNALKHLRQRQAQYLTSIEYQSANGQNIA